MQGQTFAGSTDAEADFCRACRGRGRAQTKSQLCSLASDRQGPLSRGRRALRCQRIAKKTFRDFKTENAKLEESLIDWIWKVFIDQAALIITL